MKHKLYRSLPLIAFFFILTSPLFAQNCNPNLPIDGGISALLFAGASYGMKKIYDKKKKD